MKISIEPEPKEEVVLEKAQKRFDLKAIEVLLNRLEQLTQITNGLAEKERLVYRNALFATPTLKNLLTRYAVEEGDDIPVIAEKLQRAQEEIRKEEIQFRPEARPKPKVLSEDELVVREEIMALQGEINELYKLNNQIEDELKRLDEELVFLELFVSEKEEAPMGEEVVKRRIAQYEEEIEKLLPETQPNFWGRLLKKNNEEDPFAERRNELELKLSKAVEGLDGKKKQLEAQEERLYIRLQQIQVILGDENPPLFVGPWPELVEKIRAGIEKMKERLNEEIEKNTRAAQELEVERDAREKSSK